MHDIRKHLLPAFIVGYFFAALIHMIGLLLLWKVKFKPVNQRIIISHLAFSELVNNVLQGVVYAVLTAGKWNKMWSYFDQFFYAFFVGANKLIMLYLICDRMRGIYMHTKYPIYFISKRVKIISFSLWFFCCSFSSAQVLTRASYITLPTRRKMVHIFLNG